MDSLFIFFVGAFMETVLFIFLAVIIGWFLLGRSGIKTYKKDITETCLHILKEPSASFIYYGMDEYIDSLRTLKNTNASDIEYIFHNDKMDRFIGRWINVMLHNFEEENGMIISNYYKRYKG